MLHRLAAFQTGVSLARNKLQAVAEGESWNLSPSVLLCGSLHGRLPEQRLLRCEDQSCSPGSGASLVCGCTRGVEGNWGVNDLCGWG